MTTTPVKDYWYRSRIEFSTRNPEDVTATVKMARKYGLGISVTQTTKFWTGTRFTITITGDSSATAQRGMEIFAKALAVTAKPGI